MGGQAHLPGALSFTPSSQVAGWCLACNSQCGLFVFWREFFVERFCLSCKPLAICCNICCSRHERLVLLWGHAKVLLPVGRDGM